ncbi:hypothetical protein HGRIS_009656 [Hohenbuehelia grisea]|uniref:Uncharacterized protein n=1 Tax=Hohenbuehelia grisea TaxID=104357 RepID=A0ABR3J1U0_9AGAR
MGPGFIDLTALDNDSDHRSQPHLHSDQLPPRFARTLTTRVDNDELYAVTYEESPPGSLLLCDYRAIVLLKCLPICIAPEDISRLLVQTGFSARLVRCITFFADRSCAVVFNHHALAKAAVDILVKVKDPLAHKGIPGPLDAATFNPSTSLECDVDEDKPLPREPAKGLESSLSCKGTKELEPPSRRHETDVLYGGINIAVYDESDDDMSESGEEVSPLNKFEYAPSATEVSKL